MFGQVRLMCSLCLAVGILCLTLDFVLFFSTTDNIYLYTLATMSLMRILSLRQVLHQGNVTVIFVHV